MKLTSYYRATCRCGLYRDIPAVSEAVARIRLADIGWTDLCIRCTQTEAL